MHYVVGDVHGCYEELIELLKVIEKQDSNANIIFVGDFIDRGKDVWKVLEWAMTHITENGRYQSVRGNHEQLVIQWYQEWMNWWKHGGIDSDKLMPETHFDFSLWVDAMDFCSPEKLEPIISFFRSLPTKKEVMITQKDGSQIVYDIVHAWDTFNESMDQDAMENEYIWSRECFGNYVNDKIIVHGHTPTISSGYYERGANAPGLIGYQHNAINVDGGCCFSNLYNQYPCMLCAICLETLEEFYSSSLEERFQKINKDMYEKVDLALLIGHYKNHYMNKENKFRKELLNEYLYYKLP